MPGRRRFTREDVLDAAFRVVRKGGTGMLTARAVAEELNASTMPVYTHLKSMQEIEAAVVRRAWELLRVYQTAERSGDNYIDIGLGYVMFARDERHLFSCIHAEAYKEINADYGEANFEFHLDRLIASDDPIVQGVPRDAARRILFYGWLFAHGFASLLTSGIGREVKRMESDEAITLFFLEVTRIFQAGLRKEKNEGIKTASVGLKGNMKSMKKT